MKNVKRNDIISIKNLDNFTISPKHLVHYIGNNSEEVKNKMDVILSHAYPLISQGLGWTDAIEERPDGRGNLHFEVFPKYLSENSVAMLTVCAEPDVIVELRRKTTSQKAIGFTGKYVFKKMNIIVILEHTHIQDTPRA
jgi:hypothetical protein